VLRAEYGTFQLHSGPAAPDLLQGLTSYASHTLTQTRVMGVILVLVGAILEVRPLFTGFGAKTTAGPKSAVLYDKPKKSRCVPA
jgi:hypothetical protein